MHKGKNCYKYGTNVDRLHYTLKLDLTLHVQLNFDTSLYTGQFLQYFLYLHI